MCCNSFGVWRVTAFADGDSLLRIPHGQLHLRHIALQRCRELLPDTNQFAQRGDPPGPAGGRARQFLSRRCAERGLIRTAEGQVRRIRIEAEDDCGNRLDAGIRRPRTRRGRSAPRPTPRPSTLRPERRTSVLRVGREADGPHSRRDDLRADLRPSRNIGEAPQADSGVVVLSPAYRFFDPATPLCRAVDGHRSAAACRARHATTRPTGRTRTRRGSLACVGGAYADGAVTASVRTAGDSGDRRRHAAAARSVRSSAEGADLARAEGVPLPRRGQLLGHRLVEAAHRRQMGSLRPLSDERNAGSFRSTAPAQRRTARRASFGHRRMRQYSNAFRRNILPLTNDLVLEKISYICGTSATIIHNDRQQYIRRT